MSGLVGFFKDFLPNVQNIDYNRRWEDLTENEKKGSVRPAAPPHHPNNNDHQQQNPLLAALSKPPPHQLVEYTPEPLSFKEFRKLNRESLKVYYFRRLISEEEEESEDEQAENDGDDTDHEDEEDWDSDEEQISQHHQDEDDEQEEEEDHEMALASQPAVPEEKSSDERNAASLKKRNKKWRIPPLYQAIHSIQTLDYLDLRTKDLSLDLCRVTKVWRLRETKRGVHYLRSPQGEYKQRCCMYPGRMPRIVFGHLEDDGPLACTYDYVLSLEIEQLVPAPKKTTQAKRSIRIFLYNSYAKAVSEWMEEQSMVPRRSGSNNNNSMNNNKDPIRTAGSSSYMLSLSKIPAISIFPRALDPRDWWDQEHMLNYCICLGDASSMATTREGTTTLLRADSPEMELRLANTILLGVENDPSTAGAAGSSSSELVVAQKMLLGSAEELEEDDIPSSKNHPLWNAWKKYYQAQYPAPVESAASAPLPQQGQQQQVPGAETQAPRPGPTTVPAMPNFSTIAAPAPSHAEQARPAAPIGPAPRVRIPPNRPPPPPFVERPPEPMTFEGTARRRSRITDVTNIPNNRTTAAPADYMSLATMKHTFETYRAQYGSHNFRNKAVDTYGVVMGFTAINQTKRGDWQINVTLVDERCTIPITLVIFTKNTVDLPKFQRTGDVLRLHRVGLSEWAGEVQLTGQKVSSYVVIRRQGAAIDDGASAGRWEVVPTAKKDYTFEEFDEKRSQNLWHWGQRLLREQPTMLHVNNKFVLGEMAQLTDEEEVKVKDRDLTVMVSAIIPYPNEGQTNCTPYGFLRVWDGTGQAPSDPLPIDTLGARETQRDGDPPPQCLAKLAAIIGQFNADASSSSPNTGQEATNEIIPHLDIPEAVCGKVANAIIWERAHWELIRDHVPIGTFIRLRNVDVRFWSNQNFRSLMVHGKSWLSPLPDQTYEIRTLVQEHQKRARRNEYNPISGLLPLSILQKEAARTAARDAALLSNNSSAGQVITLSLGNGLTAFSSKPFEDMNRRPRKKRKKQNESIIYKGKVRLLEETCPPFNGDLGVYCPKTAPTGTPIYRCLVTVADESERSLQVIVPHPVAEKLFGVPAADAVKGGFCRDAPFDTKAAWHVTIIQNLLAEGKRFFVLHDIEKVASTN